MDRFEFRRKSSEDGRVRSKSKHMYSFRPYQITKLEASGNQSRDLSCPQARSGHRIVADSGNIYSFGGYNPDADLDRDEFSEDFVLLGGNTLFKELWKYNIASQLWTKLKTTGPMPDEVASHAAVLSGPKLIVFGGTGVPFGENSSNRVNVCDLQSLEWTPLDVEGEPPLQQYGQGVTLHDGGLYVVGGTTGYEYSMTVHRLDLNSKQWAEFNTNNAPDPRYRHEIAIKDKELFVFGGGTASDSFGFDEVPVFNLEFRKWRIEATSGRCPTARRCHGCVQLGDDVYVCGGHDGGKIFPDVWRINLNTLKWERLKCSLPTPVYFHSAALSPLGQMFIFGGVTDIEANTRTNALYSVWLKVPPLVEMCWQAVLHYIPRIANLSKHQLLEEGVPQKFLNRIDFCTEPSGEGNE